MPNEITLGLNVGPAESALERFAGRFNSFAGNMGRAADGTNAVTSALSRLRNVLVSFAGVYALNEEMRKIDSMRKSAEALGVSFERLQRYSRAGMLAGIGNVETLLERGASFLEKLRAGEESAVRIGRNLGLGVSAGIEDLIRAVSGSPQRLVYQRAIFGRGIGARDVGALLSEVGGVNITEEFAREIERFRDAVSLFRETVTRDILNVISPIFKYITGALNSRALKYALYGVGGYFGLQAFNRFMGRGSGVLPTPGFWSVKDNAFTAMNIRDFVKAGYPAGFRYTSSISRVAAAYNTLAGGALDVPVIARVFNAMSRKMSTTLLLPAVAVFMKGMYNMVSDLRSAAALLLSPGGIVVAGVASWLYTLNSAVKYRLLDVGAVFTRVRDFVGEFSWYFRLFTDDLARLARFVGGVLSGIADRVKRAIERVFGEIDWSSFSLFGEDIGGRSVSREAADALLSERFNSYMREFNSLFAGLEGISETIRALADVKKPRDINIYVFRFFYGRLTEVINKLSSIDVARLDPERAEAITNVLEILNGYLDSFRKIEERLKSDSFIFEKIELKKMFDVDVDSIKTPDDINENYRSAINILNSLLSAGVIDIEKYNIVFKRIRDKYEEEFNNLPAVIAMNELLKPIADAWGKLQEKWRNQWEQMAKTARDVIEAVNPVERFKGRMYDAVAAFMNGLLDFDTLFRYAQGVYQDIFSVSGRGNAMVGQTAVTSYFTSVFGSISVSVWSIQQMLQSIVVNGVYLRA